jgi:hypothetical protein
MELASLISLFPVPVLPLPFQLPPFRQSLDLGFFIGNPSRLLWLPVGHMFAYSSPLTWLLHKLCLATLSDEVGQLDLVVSPLALAGFLGLHFTAMTLLPIGVLDTGQIVTGVFGIGLQHTYRQALASWL